ncbi:hypothetical protein K0651_10675 [Ornithinimicrobium sp. Arc0846-15]|nr:hypothetical protein [Ornithinimicrobium laminariae]
MSRRYDEAVEVQLGQAQVVGGRWLTTQRPQSSGMGEVPDEQGLVPTAFLWRGKLHLVQEVLTQWTQRLPWWQSAWEESGQIEVLERQIWRVEARAGRDSSTGIFDLAQGQPWQVLGVTD